MSYTSPLLLRAAALAFTTAFGVSPAAHGKQPIPGQLEIHYIDVGQGGATLIIGPDGTMMLYDFGNVPGTKYIVPYLERRVGLEKGDTIHYTFVSHADRDHYMGYRDVVQMRGADGEVVDRFRILNANYEPGSPKTSKTIESHWRGPAVRTAAGPFKAVPVGLRIGLGDGAEAHVVAANGVVVGDAERPNIRDENDRSIALFIRYGAFRYILDGDLGAGRDKCTDHQTGQLNVQERVARALLKEQFISAGDGVDVMHVAHHGSESSTSSTYFNLMRPEVAVVSVGEDQGRFLHPRVDVVEKVLLDVARPACVTAPPVKALLQTGRGADKPCSATGCTSFKGIDVGSIVISTDGKTNYRIKVEKPPASAMPHFQLPGPPPWTIPLAAPN